MEILKYVPYIVSGATAIVSFTIWFVTFLKEKDKNKKLEMLKQAILGIMETAETFKNYTGEEKKQYVFTRAKEFLVEQKLKFDDTKLSALIERFCDFSNNVNVNKKGGKK